MTFVLFCCMKPYIGVVIRTVRSCGLGLATTNREALGTGISEITRTRCSFYRILFIRTREKVAMFIVVESLTSLQWLHNSPAHSPPAVRKPENTTTPTVDLWKLQHQETFGTDVKIMASIEMFGTTDTWIRIQKETISRHYMFLAALPNSLQSARFMFTCRRSCVNALH